jgi:hypothetical protein
MAGESSLALEPDRLNSTPLRGLNGAGGVGWTFDLPQMRNANVKSKTPPEK